VHVTELLNTVTFLSVYGLMTFGVAL